MSTNGGVHQLDHEVDTTESPSSETAPKVTRPSWTRWTVGGSAFLTLFAVWGNFYVFGIVLLPFLCEFNAGRAVTSGVSSSGLLLLALFAPVATLIVERYRASVSMYGGVVMCFLGNVLASFSPNITVLYLTYGVVLGIGSSLSYTAVLVDLPLYYPVNQRSRAIAFCETGAVAGLIGMAPLMDICIKKLGWRKALWVFGCLMAVLLLPAPLAFNPKYKYTEAEKAADDRRESDASDSSGDTELEAVEAGEGVADDGVAAVESNGRLPCEPATQGPDAQLRSSPGGSGRDEHSVQIVGLQAGLQVGSASPRYSMHDVNLDCTTVDVDASAADSEPLIRDSDSSVQETPSRPVLTGWTPYKILFRNSQFNLFCLGACLWYFCFTAPLVYLVDMSEAAQRARENNTGVNATMACESSFNDSMLYIYMALALLVCFPLGGCVFDRLPSAANRLLALICLYVATGVLVAVIPLAKTQWQFVLVSVGVGVSRTPDVLHPGFLLALLGEELYPYAWTALLCASAIVDASAPPIVGALHDALGEFFTPYLLMAGVVGAAVLVLCVLFLRITSRTLTSALASCFRWPRRSSGGYNVRYRATFEE